MSEAFQNAGAGFAAGSRIGGYALHEQVGHGGMAVVFRATDERLGRRVALKILAPALAADEAFRQRFMKESRTAAAVDDPHIIPVFEAGEAAGVLFIAMRYVQGGDVRSLIFRQGVLSPDRVVSILSPIASALDAAHATGLVHRDVKPANMLLDVREGRPDHVYLTDFGLTKDALGSVGLTGTGVFLGTVDYASPEQVQGLPVDGRADQYALGCAAFEMLSGQPPFRRDQGLAVLLAHVSEPPPSITSRRPDLPGGLEAVFARVLAKSPDDRYRSCGEFGDTLREALRLPPYDPGARTIHPVTEVAVTAPVAIPGPAEAASPASAEPGPAGVGAGTDTVPDDRPHRPGSGTQGTGRRTRAGWPIAIASAAGAAAVVAVVFGVIALTGHLSGSSTPLVSVQSSTPVTSQPHSQTTQPPPFVTDLNDVWVSQLASISFSAGTARLYHELSLIQQRVPGAQIASSSYYTSLTPGYWMIFYRGPFSTGAQALAYCNELGRTTDVQCFGTFLSRSSSYRYTRCYHSAPTAATCYVRS